MLDHDLKKQYNIHIQRIEYNARRSTQIQWHYNVVFIKPLINVIIIEGIKCVCYAYTLLCGFFFHKKLIVYEWKGDGHFCEFSGFGSLQVKFIVILIIALH